MKAAQGEKSSAPLSNLLQKLRKQRHLGLHSFFGAATVSETKIVVQSPVKKRVASSCWSESDPRDASPSFGDCLQEPHCTPTPSPTSKALQEDLASLKNSFEDDDLSVEPLQSKEVPGTPLEAWSLEQQTPRDDMRRDSKESHDSVGSFGTDDLQSGLDELDEVDIWDEFSEYGDLLLPGSLEEDEAPQFAWDESFGAGTRLKDACKRSANSRMSKLLRQPVTSASRRHA